MRFQSDEMNPRNKIPRQVRSAVHDALQLLESVNWIRKDEDAFHPPDPLPSLLDQCGKLAAVGEQAEPIRLIHHLACTGGTLIAKCLACVPNVHVLSEVDPLSTLGAYGGTFAPRDLLRLVELSNRQPSAEEKIDLFMAGLDQLYERNRHKGLRLLIRDHAQSHFCVGTDIPERPSLKSLLANRYPVKSIVTVRHPIDSYLSLLANRWIHFDPATPDEYARRYEAFLDQYAAEPIFRYEDFLANPRGELARMCEALDYPYPEGFEHLFFVHRFSGDSGRSGSDLSPRSRRPVPDAVARLLSESSPLQRLCARMGYEIEI